MKLLGLIMIIVGAATATSMAAANEFLACDNSKDAILECALKLFDVNHDGSITMAELNQTIPTLEGMPGPNVNASFIMKCDMNGDNILTLEDWNHPNSTCLPTENCRFIACEVCRRNGFVMTLGENRAKFDYRAAVDEAKKTHEALQKLAKLHNEDFDKYRMKHQTMGSKDLEIMRQRVVEEHKKRDANPKIK